MFRNEAAVVPETNALQNRLPDVGIGLHEVRQAHLLKQETKLARLNFRVKRIDGKPALEYDAIREVDWNGEKVRIKGRLDAILEFLDENVNVTHEAIYDLKSKTLKKKLSPSALVREVNKNVPQMVAYRILTDIPLAIIPYESTQKDWSGDGPDGDLTRVLIEVGDFESVAHFEKDAERAYNVKQSGSPTYTVPIGANTILDKFAAVVASVRKGTPPPMEPDAWYCKNACPFADACHRDNMAAMKGAA